MFVQRRRENKHGGVGPPPPHPAPAGCLRIHATKEDATTMARVRCTLPFPRFPGHIGRALVPFGHNSRSLARSLAGDEESLPPSSSTTLMQTHTTPSCCCRATRPSWMRSGTCTAPLRWLLDPAKTTRPAPNLGANRAYTYPSFSAANLCRDDAEARRERTFSRADPRRPRAQFFLAAGPAAVDRSGRN
jgi:hypothetical protein